MPVPLPLGGQSWSLPPPGPEQAPCPPGCPAGLQDKAPDETLAGAIVSLGGGPNALPLITSTSPPPSSHQGLLDPRKGSTPRNPHIDPQCENVGPGLGHRLVLKDVGCVSVGRGDDIDRKGDTLYRRTSKTHHISGEVFVYGYRTEWALRVCPVSMDPGAGWLHGGRKPSGDTAAIIYSYLFIFLMTKEGECASAHYKIQRFLPPKKNGKRRKHISFK